ncbi:MAG TPA: hypothetical protein VMR19_04095 [Candidatus Saccharimonadales bacterium]|nr:hypothetical protein [Candidatus Saccharimonadales bacterium]
MKFIIKLVLTIIFIPVFLIFILAINLRFQILAPSFWEKVFISGDVYTKLSTSINENLESEAVIEGGKPGDVNILTDLISPENLQDAINKNINNFLEYANGKTGEIVVYIPVSKIPKAFLSTSFNTVKEQMSLSDLIKEFNISGISAAQIQMISHLGEAAWLILLFSASLVVLILCLLYLCVSPGKRLVAPGLALILSGLTELSIYFMGTFVGSNFAGNLVGISNVGDSLIGIIVPPILKGLFNLWLPNAIGAIVFGTVLLFIKKSGYIRKPK